MNTRQPHITEIFKRFAGMQQQRLINGDYEIQDYLNESLEQLLSCYQWESENSLLRQTLLDPYFPLGMLERTIFADVAGMRFFINKQRPDLQSALAAEFLAWAKIFARIKRDIKQMFNTATITCIPMDGLKHQLPSDQWCTLCGVCCQIGGVPPLPPPEVHYPDDWHTILSGKMLDNQQLCPFLWQYFGEPRFFCAIHHIKPIACRKFDRKDCEQRLNDRNLHA